MANRLSQPNPRHGLPQVPRDAPKGTGVATKQVKGDGFGVDSVTLGGFCGTRAWQTAWSGPKATADAVRLAKGNCSSGVIIALVAFHDMRDMGHSKGDGSLVVTNENWPLAT